MFSLYFKKNFVMPKSQVIDVYELAAYLSGKFPKLCFSDFRQLDSDSPILKDICLKFFKRFDRNTKYYIKKYFLRHTGDIKSLLIDEKTVNFPSKVQTVLVKKIECVLIEKKK